MSLEDAEELAPEQIVTIESDDISDVAVYSQTLCNTVGHLCGWEVIEQDERLFRRIQIKRLIDAQLSFKPLFIDEED